MKSFPVCHVVTTKKGITETELAGELGVHPETAHNLRQRDDRTLRAASQHVFEGLWRQTGGKSRPAVEGPALEGGGRRRPRRALVTC